VPLVITDFIEQPDHALFGTFKNLQNVIPFREEHTGYIQLRVTASGALHHLPEFG
jgi:hypothetical protein